MNPHTLAPHQKAPAGQPAPSQAIAFESFSFSYATDPDLAAVGPVSWQVEEGAFCLLVGGTGSGKTTLLRQMKPQIAPHGTSSGTLRVFGEDPATWTVDRSARAVGFVPQNPESDMVCSTVWHELAFGLENLGTPQNLMRRRVAEVSYFFGLDSWLDRSTDELSGGQKQLLCLASTLALRPRLLLLDEPTAQLDPVAQQNFLHALFRVNRELGITVVVATHQPEAMRAYATQIFRLENNSAQAHDQQILADLAQTLRTSDPGTPQTTTPALKLKDAYVSYAAKSPFILRGLDLQVLEGSVHALVGGNGCGKTTLLSAIAGLLKPKRGKIVNRLQASQVFLPQNPKALFVCDTVEEELAEWAAPAEAERWLRMVRLEKLRHHHPFDLSGGQQQLLALAKVLACHPRLILLDEPTKGLDAASKLRVLQVLLQARQAGATLVMATHDLPFAQVAASHISLMFDGQIASTEPPQQFFADNLFYRPAQNAFTHLWDQALRQAVPDPEEGREP